MKTVQLIVSATFFTFSSFSAVADYDRDQGAIFSTDTQDIVISYSGDLQAEALLRECGTTNKGNSDNHHSVVSITKRHNGLDLQALENNVEQACLALTLGQLLKTANTNANVTLFIRNDGVALANREVVQAIADLQDRGIVSKCQTTTGAYSLQENLEAFLADESRNLVNCPLCWCARFAPGFDFPACLGGYDGYGVLDPTAIAPLFLGAEKVIDF
jgi:hypothetical protein